MCDACLPVACSCSPALVVGRADWLVAYTCKESQKINIIITKNERKMSTFFIRLVVLVYLALVGLKFVS